MRGAETFKTQDMLDPAGTRISPESIRSYLDSLSDRGRGHGTVQMYRAKLQAFYSFLPPDKWVAPGTLAAWQQTLLAQGYSPSTVNTHLTAVNGLLAYMGRRDLQLVGQLDHLPAVQPELTRAEYLRLLQAARVLGKERAYLLVKVFALVGLRVGELSQLTVGAVRDGRLLIQSGKRRQYASIPDCLQRELLDYAAARGIKNGPIFVSRSGSPIARNRIALELQQGAGGLQSRADMTSSRSLNHVRALPGAAIPGWADAS